MKVLCINRKVPLTNHPALWDAYHKIRLLEVYTVVNEEEGSFRDHSQTLYYELEEVPPVYLPEFGRTASIVVEADCFIPLSNMDENQLAFDRFVRQLRELCDVESVVKVLKTINK